MPRVVEDQLGKFNTDPLFKQMQVQSELVSSARKHQPPDDFSRMKQAVLGNSLRQTKVRYTGYHNCSVEERRIRFCTDCYEGSCKIGFLRNGVNLLLSFPKAPNSQYTSSEYVDFIREPGKVFLVSSLIFNGVCVKFYGWLDVQRLRGFGSLVFDEESAQIEDDFLRETLRRKHGSLEAASAAKAFEDMCYNTSSEVDPRSSCIYDCRRIARSRYSV